VQCLAGQRFTVAGALCVDDVEAQASLLQRLVDGAPAATAIGATGGRVDDDQPAGGAGGRRRFAMVRHGYRIGDVQCSSTKACCVRSCSRFGAAPGVIMSAS